MDLQLSGVLPSTLNDTLSVGNKKIWTHKVWRFEGGVPPPVVRGNPATPLERRTPKPAMRRPRGDVSLVLVRNPPPPSLPSGPT